MKIKPVGKIVILLLVLGAAVGGFRVWNGRQSTSDSSTPDASVASDKGGGILSKIPFLSRSESDSIGGDQGILGRPLIVAVNTWPGFAGGVMANDGRFKANRESLYWTNHNLLVKFVLIDDPELMNKAWARGDVDIIWSTVDAFASTAPGFLKSGVKVRTVMQADWSRGGDAIVAGPDIQRIEDLKGKKVSLTTQAPSHWLLATSLFNSSLDEDDQDAILKRIVGKMSSADAEKDFVAGKVDAFVGWEPDITAALRDKEGAHIVVSTKTAANLISDILVCSEEFATKNHAVLKAFIQGWFDGTEVANRNPQGVVKMLTDNYPTYKDLGSDETLDTLSTVHYATLADNAKMFGLDGSAPLFDRIFRTAGDAWVKMGLLSSTVSPAQVKNITALKEIFNAQPKESRRVTRQEFKFKPAAPAKQKAKALLTKQVQIQFGSNSDDLTQYAKTRLDDVATLLTTYSNAYVRVEGNSASTGNPRGEVILSERRARAVTNYMVNRYNFDRNRFITVGNGPYKPVATNATEAGQKKNRRTDIAIIEK